jgi:Co/Zn/Cd efflux system component
MTRIRHGFPGISRALGVANSLLLLTVILGLSGHNQSSVLVLAYSPHAGVSIVAHPPAYLSSRRIPSTDFSVFPQHQMSSSSSTRRSRWDNEQQQEQGYSTSTTLYHMGHSHSHHEHHDHSTSAEPKVLNKQRILRRLALVLFCWIATCGTKLVQTATNVNGAKRFVGLSQNDWISFVVTSVALTSAKKVMSAVQESVERFRRFAEGIRKHSSTAEVQEYLDPQHPQVPLADKADADRVTWIGVAVNLLLSVGKLGIGITAHSSALVADAGHSLSDLVSDFITLWSVNVARLPPDEDHPYGHYKFEAIGSLFLSLTLLATGASVGLMANKQLMDVLQATASSSASKVPVQLPGPLALVMAAVSIFSKEWLFRITKEVGERLRSPVVIANAWHHRSDAYSSVLALFSIAWAMVGFPAADAAAGMYVEQNNSLTYSRAEHACLLPVPSICINLIWMELSYFVVFCLLLFILLSS